MDTLRKAQALARAVSDKTLFEMWAITDAKLDGEISLEDRDAIFMTRGWILDEFDRRFGEDRVEQWLDAQTDAGQHLNPDSFLLPATTGR